LAVAVLLVPPAYLFVLRTFPYRTPVLPPPDVALTERQKAHFARFPGFTGAIPVLSYHDIANRRGTYTLPPERFAKQLAALRAAGFQSVKLADVKRLVAHEPVHLPARPILLIFEDGVSSQYTTVDPILRRYGFTAVSFLPTSSIASKSPSYYLTSDEIQVMLKSKRWEFGAQTHKGHGYVVLPKGGVGQWLTNRAGGAETPTETFEQWRTRVTADLDRNQEALRKLTGHPVEAFSYPFTTPKIKTNDARIPPALDRLLSERFSLAFDPSTGPAEPITAGSRRLRLPRFVVTARTGPDRLLERLERNLPLPPPRDPATLPFTSERGCAAGRHRLSLTGRSYRLCVADVNGNEWLDYQVRGMVTGVSRDATGIVAVRVGQAGRAEVAIGESGVVVRQLLSDRWSVLSRVTFPSADGQQRASPRSQPVDIRLVGSRLVANINGSRLSTQLDGQLRSGVVGFGFAPRRQQTVTFTELGITTSQVPRPA
jgi:peptidoglycan/xylan/chitin deacetylase (PgdA/CDA1 family)